MQALGIGIQKEFDTNEQSQTLPIFQYFLMNEIKTDITLTDPIGEDEDKINVSAGHGFTAAAGEYIVVRNGDQFLQMEVKAVLDDEIMVEMPISTAFPDTSSVIRGNINMNVNGSATPVDFEYTSDKNGGVNPVIPIDINTVVLTMQHATEADDSKFGDIAALGNGFYFRKVNSGKINFGNYKNNQKFRDFGAIVEYTDKAGAGNFSTSIIFNAKEVFTQEIRLDPRTVDSVLGEVRDNIVLVKFTVSLIGSFTSGE